MITLDLKEDDLVIENGDFKLISEEQELMQGLERRLTTMLTEFFLEPIIGLDLNPLQSKNPDLQEIRDAVGDCVSQESRVLSVDSIDIELNADRTVVINFKATTTLGIIESEVIS